MMRTRSAAMALLVGLAMISACSEGASKPPSPGAPLSTDEVIRTDAVVRFSDLEGGCWMLEVNDRGLYQPIDLPQAYREDGLIVHVKLRDAPDMVSICQMGPLVHLDSIARK